MVIIGIRPEHFEDAALVGDKRDEGSIVRANVDLLESLGSDKYAYFTVKGERASAQHLEELAQDRGGVEMSTEEGVQMTARLDAASAATRTRSSTSGSTCARCTSSTRTPART